ncbi:MAG: hypothetical protein GF329_21770 [Candidatus Lokiarchaeota archaeon]|nr:hypothetical protein [Candidatus Lokiarchaeota archaeon]
MNKNSSKTIVILGMHRSGTSMVAGILARLGINMGNEISGKGLANPMGYYEDQKFKKLNDEILMLSGGSWDNPPDEESIFQQQKLINKEIQNLLNNKKGIWGWKDPRTSLTIELYLPYLKKVFFLICHRSSPAVAKSLKKRNNMSIEEGIKLREIYERRIEIFFSKYPNLKRLDLNYEEILSNPKKSINNIIKFLKIQITNKQFINAINFVLPNERLHNISKRMLLKRRIKFYSKHPWLIPKKIIDKILEKFLKK